MKTIITNREAASLLTSNSDTVKRLFDLDIENILRYDIINAEETYEEGIHGYLTIDFRADVLTWLSPDISYEVDDNGITLHGNLSIWLNCLNILLRMSNDEHVSLFEQNGEIHDMGDDFDYARDYLNILYAIIYLKNRDNSLKTKVTNTMNPTSAFHEMVRQTKQWSKLYTHSKTYDDESAINMVTYAAVLIPDDENEEFSTFDLNIYAIYLGNKANFSTPWEITLKDDKLIAIHTDGDIINISITDTHLHYVLIESGQY